MGVKEYYDSGHMPPAFFLAHLTHISKIHHVIVTRNARWRTQMPWNEEKWQKTYLLIAAILAAVIVAC